VARTQNAFQRATALGCRTTASSRTSDVGLHILLRIVGLRLALGVQATRPVQLVNELRAPQRLTGLAIQCISVAVTVGVQGCATERTVDLRIDEGVLGDRVIVIRVVRRVLEAPLEP
jgi:hypothetical protein